MRFIILTILLIPAILWGDILLSEEQLISSPYYRHIDTEIISDTILIIYNECDDIWNIEFLSMACSFFPLCIHINRSDTFSVKHTIDSIALIRTFSAIALIGDILDINAFCRTNPYDNSTFVTDCPYGMFENDIVNSIPVSRIPFSDSIRIGQYFDNTIDFLVSDMCSSVGLMGHFYDADIDSVEDFLYIRSLNKIHNDIFSDFSTDMLLTADHLYINQFFDLSYVPSYLCYPQEDFSANIFSVNCLFINPAFLLFWGHANRYSTVAPNISIQDLSQLHCPYSGTICLFCCLAGDISSTCIADSMLCCKSGLSAVIASSSLTFYQYNRYMTDISPAFIKTYNSVSGFLCSIRHSLLEFAGVNEFSTAHAISYSALGLPFIPITKDQCCNTINAGDSVNPIDNSIEVFSQDMCSISIFNSHMYYEHVICKGTNIVPLHSIIPNDTIFFSSFRNGYLSLDTSYVKGSDIYCSSININDCTGDFDLIPEFGETLVIEMNVHCTLPPCTLYFNSDDFTLLDTIAHIPDTVTAIGITAIVSSNNNIALLGVHAKNYNASFTFNIENREMIADSFIINSSGSIMTDSMYCTSLYMRTGYHDFDSCWIFFNDNNVDFLTDSIFVYDTGSSFIIFNYAIFREDSGSFTIHVQSRFLKDSICIDYAIAGKELLCIYDPMGNYTDTSLLLNIADSLNIRILTDNDPLHSPICKAYIFCMGNYPDNQHLSDSLADFILSLSGMSNILLEGNDCLGYDNAGKLLWSEFGISDCSDGADLDSGAHICFPMSTAAGFLKHELKSADISVTSSPLLMHAGIPLGSFNNRNLAQSISLHMFESPFLSNIYYSYLSFLMNMDSDICLKHNISLSDSLSFLIHNNNKDPVYADILYMPSFLESCVFSSHYIAPDSFIRIYCYVSPWLIKGEDSLVIITDIQNQYRSVLHYRKNTQSFICYRHTDDCLIIYKNGSDIILPRSRSCFHSISSGDSIIIWGTSDMPVPIKLIEADSMGEIINIFTLTVPGAKNAIYNILGQQIIDARIPGIYFDNNGKFLRIK